MRAVRSCAQKEVYHALNDITTGSDFKGCGCFVGINNRAIARDGTRTPHEPLLLKMCEREWRRSLVNLHAIGIAQPGAVCLDDYDDGSTAYTAILDPQILLPTVGSERVCVRYWGLELEENTSGEGMGDPRAQLLCYALTETRKRWPYVYVYAHLSFVN